MEIEMKIKPFKLGAAATICFFCGGGFAAGDLVVLPNSPRISETFTSVRAGVVQLPSAAHTFASTAPSAVITSPFNIAYISQPLTFTNFPRESANRMIFYRISQSEFSFANPHSELYAVKFTGVADNSQKSKPPAQTAQQPEPYAMMLAGLGMMGAIVRRRHKASGK